LQAYSAETPIDLAYTLAIAQHNDRVHLSIIAVAIRATDAQPYT
jgi:hypothetical protein